MSKLTVSEEVKKALEVYKGKRTWGEFLLHLINENLRLKKNFSCTQA